MPPVAVIVTAPLLCPLHATLVISAVAPKSLPALFTTKLISAVQPFASTNSAVYKPDAKPVKVTSPPAPTASVVPSTVISPAVSEPIVTSPSLAPQSVSTTKITSNIACAGSVNSYTPPTIVQPFASVTVTS